MKTVAFYTLGCKLNFSETSTIGRQLIAAGYQKVEFENKSDVYIVNTCSVTDNADKKCRQIVKKALKQNPEAFVAVIGCYAQLKPDEIAAIPGVDIVLGAGEKFNILNFIEEKKKEKGQAIGTEIKTVKEFVPSFSAGDRTRSFLKVQDGCDYFCNFCTIPLARGASRSATIAETIAEAKKVAATDIKEVVLTGVNIGDFGKDTNENLLGLLQELDKIEGIDRYRISSIEPNLLTNEIIEFVSKSNKFVPHFHIPLQSGSDELLKKMRRKYLSDLYKDRVATIKRLMPNCCIGVDVIVGFPTETDDLFKETYNFLNELDISYLHVFTYSERDNTGAKKLGGVVPRKVRAERSKMLHILSDKKKRAFYDQHLGKTFSVLFEAENKDGSIHGFTENYIKVTAPYQPELVNQFKEVTLSEINSDGMATFKTINELNYCS
jgi:threonylcarbamoyladenosine tRNA methylthiotransferase MtaB